MKMNANVKLERQNCCIICSGSCSLETVTVNQDILILLKFIAGTEPSDLQDSPICDSCVSKIHSTYDFKISYLENVQATCDLDIKEINLEKVIICYFCKKTVSKKSCRELLELPYGQDVINQISTKKNEIHNPPVCESCQVALSSLTTLSNWLISYENKSNHDRIDLEITDNKNVINVKSTNLPLIEKSNLDLDISLNNIKQEIKIEKVTSSKESTVTSVKDEPSTSVTDENTIFIKEEVEDIEEDDADVDYQIKTEELDLKMDCEAGPSGEGSLDCSKTNVSVSKKPIPNIEDEHTCLLNCGFCSYQSKYKWSLITHLLEHRQYDKKNKVFKCWICKYQSKYMANLGSHLLQRHKNYDIQLYRCKTCDFRTRYKDYLKEHKVMHKDINSEELLKCPKCHFIADCKFTLEIHTCRNRKKPSPSPKYSCDNCTFSTFTKKSLKKHILEHKTYTCQHCDYESLDEEAFKVHEKVHTRYTALRTYSKKFKQKVEVNGKKIGDIKDEIL